MIAKLKLNNKIVQVNFSEPLDISIPLTSKAKNVSAWYVPPVKIEPVIDNSFIGSIAEGGNVNFRNIYFNPHGNGTHTECVGHIDKNIYSINKCLKEFMFTAKLITVQPVLLEKDNGYQQKNDLVITLESIKNKLAGTKAQAIIIRTLPNTDEKMYHQYSNTNPPYLCHQAAKYIAKINCEHLLIDLPSVDKEVDNGRLLAHKAFWEHPENTKFNRTITELIYVPNSITDGNYLLNLQIASFENDASPSKPILYNLL